MKRQKKYTKREQVMKDIESALRKLGKLQAESYAQDNAADLLFSVGDADAQKHRDLATGLRKKADRLKNTRLQKLKRALAAIDTKPLGLPGAENPQVTLENIER